MEAINKKIGVAVSNRSRLVVEVELSDSGRLSICGEESCTGGGGSGGQMQDHIEADAARIAAEPGGKRLMCESDLSALVGIWRRWHLNDMRAGCEHQTGPAWDTGKRIAFDSYSVDWDDRRAIERQRDRDAKAAGLDYGSTLPAPNREAFRRFSHAEALLSLLERCKVLPFGWQAVTGRPLALLADAFEIITEAELPAYRAQVERHRGGQSWKWGGKFRASFVNPKPPILKRTESKGAGWVRPDEHPEGFLTKPCGVCGYKYGTAWKREEVPAEVVAELRRIVDGRPEFDGPARETFRDDTATTPEGSEDVTQ